MEAIDGMVDWGAYYFFRYRANQVPSLDPIMHGGYLLGEMAPFLGLIAAFLFFWSLGQNAGWKVMLYLLIAIVLAVGIAQLTNRQRPPDAQKFLGAGALSPSFPCRPVLVSAFAWFLIAAGLEFQGYRWWVYIPAGLAIVFVCFSHLWLGLCLVTDVVAGLCAGLALALTARWTAFKAP